MTEIIASEGASGSGELVLSDRAAIELLDSAEKALAKVSTPEDADELWRRMKAVEEAARLARVAEATVGAMTRVRLRAKRRWGELQGPVEPTPPPPGGVSHGHAISDGDRKQAERARKLAAVPREVFEAALENTEPENPPSEASLLRQSTGRGMGVHYSSAKDEWATPQDLFDELDAEFRFTLDVCALESSAKCKRYFTPEDDGLAQDWKKGVCWMNPPYGEAIGDWMRKALDAAGKGAVVVCLVPARVDTGWWWDTCLYGEIRFIKGRLKFGGGSTGAPFPSAVVVFGDGYSPRVKWWKR